MDAALGKATAADVTDEDIRYWVIRFPRRPKTIHNYHGPLSAGFHWGHGKGLCPVNPCNGIAALGLCLTAPRSSNNTGLGRVAYVVRASDGTWFYRGVNRCG